MNGDGKIDLVVMAQNDVSGLDKVFSPASNPYWKVYLNTGLGFSTNVTNWTIPIGGKQGFNGNWGFNAFGGSASTNSTVDNQTWSVMDMNGDGKLDLVIGEENGSLNYCRNNGTVTAPDFSNTQSSFGNVIVQQNGSVVGFSVPCFVKLNNATTWTLLVGCEGGNVFQYDSIENSISGTFNLVDTSFANIEVGSFSAPSATDINNDGIPEIAIGNYRGGVTVFDTSTAHNYTALNDFVNGWMLELYPNPVIDLVTVKANHEISKAELFDELGRKLFSIPVNEEKEFQFNTSQLTPALYVIRLSGANGNCAIKFVKN